MTEIDSEVITILRPASNRLVSETNSKTSFMGEAVNMFSSLIIGNCVMFFFNSSYFLLVVRQMGSCDS